MCQAASKIKLSPNLRLTMQNRLFATSNDLVLGVLRLIVGVAFFAHGAQQALGWFGGFGLSATLGGLSKMGMPGLLAWYIICATFLGGLGLLLGFLTRVAAAAIIVLMLGAIFMVHIKVGFFMNWYGQLHGEGFEYHLLAIGGALVLLFKGGGAFSVDRAIAGSSAEPAVRAT